MSEDTQPVDAKAGSVIRSEMERPRQSRERYVFGTAQAKLPVGNTDPNWHYHWANDVPGRIELFLASAYVFVQPNEVTFLSPGVTPRSSEVGDRVSAIVGRND